MFRLPTAKEVMIIDVNVRDAAEPASGQTGLKRKRSSFARSIFAILLGLSISSAASGLAHGEDAPEFTIEMKDGAITPERLTIPAGKTVKIIVKNTGSTPAEFESRRLRKEKVLSPGAESFIVLRGLSAGEYPFFDEFHTDAKPGVIVAE